MRAFARARCVVFLCKRVCLCMLPFFVVYVTVLCVCVRVCVCTFLFLLYVSALRMSVMSSFSLLQCMCSDGRVGLQLAVPSTPQGSGNRVCSLPVQVQTQPNPGTFVIPLLSVSLQVVCVCACARVWKYVRVHVDELVRVCVDVCMDVYECVCVCVCWACLPAGRRLPVACWR